MSAYIEKAKAEHAREMAKIITEAWQTAYMGILPQEYLNEAASEKEISRLEKFFTDSITKNWNDNFIIGDERGYFGCFTVGASRDKGDDGGELVGIYLLKENRNKGYGRKCIEYAENILRDKYRVMSLWVLEGNIGAIEFYKNLGFAFTGEKKEVDLGGKFFELKMAKSLKM